MKKRYIASLALAAILALPAGELVAQATGKTYTVTGDGTTASFTNGSTVVGGAVLAGNLTPTPLIKNSVNGSAQDITNGTANGTAFHNYIIDGNWTLRPGAALTEQASAITTLDPTGIFKFNVDVDFEASSSKQMAGFTFQQTTAPFAGTINAAGKTIKVYNTGTALASSSPGSDAIGLAFLDSGAARVVEGKVNVGTLDVSSNASNAFGWFSAGIVGAGDGSTDVSIDNIIAQGANDADGFHIEGNINGATVLKNKSIDATSTAGEAKGFLVSKSIYGDVQLGTINASGKTNTSGVQIGTFGAGGEGGLWAAGSLTTGDINAVAAQGATGQTYGITSYGGFTGNVKLGNITADSTASADGVSDQAVGITTSGKIVGKFTTGDIDVKANTTAIGVSVNSVTGSSVVPGKTPTQDVAFGKISASSTADNGQAYGIAVNGVATGAAVNLGGVNRNLGLIVTENVSAKATGNGAGTKAAGISLGANSTLSLAAKKGEELEVIGLAEGTNSQSYGISAGASTTVNVAGKVSVLGDHNMGNVNTTVGNAGETNHIGISTANNLSVNLTDGAEFVTNGVAYAGTLAIDTVDTDTDAKAAGSASARFDIGSIYGPGNVSIANQGNLQNGTAGVDANSRTTVSMNLANNTNMGIVTVGDRVNVEVYGDVADSVLNANDNPPLYTVGQTVVQGNFNGKDISTSSYQNLSVFTDWILVPDSLADSSSNTHDIVYNGIRQKAYMNDGFLAALMMHQRNAVFNAARDHMISFGGNRAYRGQECDPCAPVSECDPCEEVAMCDPCDPCGTMGSKSRRGFGLGSFTKGASTRNAWVNYIGRSDSYESSYNGQDWKIGMDGVQVGTDLYRTNRGQFGVIFGYEGGNAYNALDRVQADDVYIGMYGARVLRGGADVRFALSYGWQDYTMNRSSRILPPQPRALYVSNFEGNTLEANLELGKRFYRGCWSFRPVMGLDLTSNEIDAAQETAAVVGMDGPLGYSNSRLTQAFARVGSDLRFQRNRFTFNSGMYLAYDLRGQDLDAQVTRLTAPVYSTKLAGSELGRTLLTFNVGGSYQLCKNLSVFGGYQGEALLGGDAGGYMSTGHVGGAWRW